MNFREGVSVTLVSKIYFHGQSGVINLINSCRKQALGCEFGFVFIV